MLLNMRRFSKESNNLDVTFPLPSFVSPRSISPHSTLAFSPVAETTRPSEARSYSLEDMARESADFAEELS